MSWIPRVSAVNTDSIATYDALASVPYNYNGTFHTPCNPQGTWAMIAALKGGGSYVQGTGSASGIGSFSAITQAFAGNNAAGNAIVVDVVLNGSFPLVTPTVTDSQGNTYTQIQFGHIGGNSVFAGQFVAFNVVGGANTITISLSGAGVPIVSYAVAIQEYSGLTAIDSHANTNLVGGPGSGIVTIATNAGGDLLHYMIGTVPACAATTVGGPVGGPIIPGAWLVINEPTLGYTDRTSYLYRGPSNGHSFTLEMRQRGQATIHLNVLAGDTYTPTRGSPIYLFDQTSAGYTLVWSGLIEDLEYQYYSNQGDHFVIITAVSWESVFDTVYVDRPVGAYQNQTCGFILTDLFNTFESGCGVTLGTISPGATIPSFTPQVGQKLSEIFSQLATTSGFTWSVSAQTQALFFGQPSIVGAPFELTSAQVIWDSEAQLTWKVNGRDYRNRQGVKLSYDAFPHSMEYFAGAGQLQFTLARAPEQVTNVYVTTATQASATGSFSGRPNVGDTVTIGPASEVWQSNHIYGTGGIIIFQGFVFQVTTAGTSGGTIPNFAGALVPGNTVVDSAVIWTNQGALGLGTNQQIYTFVDSIDNRQFGQVLRGASGTTACQNLADAINANAAVRNNTPNNTVSLPTWENGRVNATAAGTTLTVKEKTPGASPRSDLSASGGIFVWNSTTTGGGSSPQTSVGPNEGAWISIACYVQGTSTAAPGLAYIPGSVTVNLATPLNAGTNLVVEYTRQDGNLIQVEDTAQVTALAAITHGTGKYQQVTDQSSTGLVSTSASAGLQLAQQILAAFSTAPQELDFTVFVPGLFPAMDLTVLLTAPLIAGSSPILNGQWIVQSMEVVLVPVGSSGASPWLLAPTYGHYRYSVKVVNIQIISDWLDFWNGGGGGSGGSGGVGGGDLVATSGGGGSTVGLSPTTGGVNYRTSSYTAIDTDNGKDIVFQSGGSPLINPVLTLPATPPTAQWNIFVENLGIGTVIVSPNGKQLDGSVSGVDILPGYGIYITTDGTNYFTSRGNPPLATTLEPGIVKPDGTTITIDATGKISAVGGAAGMTLIASSVLSGAAASVTFSSIPGTYNNLMLVVCGRTNKAGTIDNVIVAFNGDAAANYNLQFMFATGTGTNIQSGLANGVVPTAGTISGNTATAGRQGCFTMQILGYAGTTFQKISTANGTFDAGVSGLQTYQVALNWTNSAAITSLVITPQSAGNFLAGSAFYLYGY